MGKGNIAKVIADSAKIAKRLRNTDVTLRELRAEYHCGYSILIEAIRYHISLREWKKLRHKRLAKGGVKTRFQKGQAAWNKGLHYNPGGRSIETRFKKGHLHGQAARNWRPIGTVTVRHDKPPKRLRGRKRKEGMPPWRGKPRRWIKVKDNGPMQYRWIPYARYLWQKQNGKIPAGFLVVHIDGDQMNDVIKNLALVDHRRHLALQIKRDPGHLVRMRKAASKFATQRNQVNRNLRKLYGPKIIIFDCNKCGASYRASKAPQKCIKCGSGSFEKILLREKVAV